LADSSRALQQRPVEAKADSVETFSEGFHVRRLGGVGVDRPACAVDDVGEASAVAQSKTTLVELFGVGPVLAAKLLGEVGDRADPLAGERLEDIST
jgi:hypothetical protein